MEKSETYRKQQLTFSDALGRHLFVLRKTRGLSQEDIARRAEISLNGYKNLERGKLDNGRPSNPRMYTLIAVSNAFEMSLVELLAPIGPIQGGVDCELDASDDS